jgi:hypothetical protein
MPGNEQYQHDMPGSSLEELLAQRVAAEAIQPPYHREVMNADEAAGFLRLSPTAFRRLGPKLPRCQIYERSGYRYLRSDLLAWLRVRKDAAETQPHLEARRGTKSTNIPPKRGVRRLI